MASVQIEIQGRVQGVGFRAHVARIAQDLNLSGEVWNTRDGSVGAVLQSANVERIREALIRIYEGPGRIDRVVPQVLPNDPPYASFEIKKELR